MNDKDRLSAVLTRRDDLKASVERYKGRLSAAKSALEDAEKECRDMGVEPDQLPDAIAALEARYSEALAQMKEKIEEAETKLAPFDRENS